MLEALRGRLYDTSQINEHNCLFSNKDLRILLIPLVIEQFLNSIYGYGRYNDGE